MSLLWVNGVLMLIFRYLFIHTCLKYHNVLFNRFLMNLVDVDHTIVHQEDLVTSKYKNLVINHPSIHSFIHPFIHPSIHPFIPPSIPQSFIHPFIHPLIDPFIHSSIVSSVLPKFDISLEGPSQITSKDTYISGLVSGE